MRPLQLLLAVSLMPSLLRPRGGSRPKGRSEFRAASPVAPRAQPAAGREGELSEVQSDIDPPGGCFLGPSEERVRPPAFAAIVLSKVHIYILV
jgi:hypothetical protein